MHAVRSRAPRKGAVLDQKALQESKKETRELLGGMKVSNILAAQG